MVKMAVQRGRNERRGESYSAPYVEPLSDTRTKLADFFNILLVIPGRARRPKITHAPGVRTQNRPGLGPRATLNRTDDVLSTVCRTSSCQCVGNGLFFPVILGGTPIRSFMTGNGKACGRSSGKTVFCRPVTLRMKEAVPWR